MSPFEGLRSHLFNYRLKRGVMQVGFNFTTTSSTCRQTSSCLEASFSSAALRAFLYAASGLVVLLTAFGNLLVIVSVSHFKLLHTPTNMLLLSMAASDFLVGVFVMPFHFIWLIESCWSFGPAFCTFFNLASAHLTAVSLQNVALISVDRFLALSFPFVYAKRVSLNLSYAVVLFTWLSLFTYSSVLVYFNRSADSGGNCLGECVFSLDEVCSLIDLVLFVLPCALIILLYSQVLFIARKHSRAIQELNAARRNVASTKNERKAAKVLGILVAVFLTCLLPYYVSSIVASLIATETTQKVMKNVITLYYLNSTINPVIYALFYPWFKRSVAVIFTCRILSTDSSLINVMASRP